MQQYRTIKLKVNCSKSDLKRLTECQKESAIIWNTCIKSEQEYFKSNNQFMSKDMLQEIVKNTQTNFICANSKKLVSRKVYDAFKAIYKARKQGRTDLYYPYKEKYFYPTEWDYQYIFPDYNKNCVGLTTARYIGADENPHNGKQIVLSFKTPLPDKIQTLKLIYDNGYYACISYLVDIESKQANTNNVASIDLGEIHSITSIDNLDNQLIITGRKIREIKQFRNKKQAELRSKMDKCKKGSKQRKKYKRALKKIKHKCDNQLKYSIHKLARLYTDWAVEKGISAVYVGDVTGIEINSDKGTNVNQKLNQWNYGKIMYYLEYKLGLEGIKLIKVSEAYSSQICPCCGFKNKVKGRHYVCNNCNSEFHRDIVGAWNILKMNTNLQLELPERNIKYLRIT